MLGPGAGDEVPEGGAEGPGPGQEVFLPGQEVHQPPQDLPATDQLDTAAFSGPESQQAEQLDANPSVYRVDTATASPDPYYQTKEEPYQQEHQYITTQEEVTTQTPSQPGQMVEEEQPGIFERISNFFAGSKSQDQALLDAMNTPPDHSAGTGLLALWMAVRLGWQGFDSSPFSVLMSGGRKAGEFMILSAIYPLLFF